MTVSSAMQVLSAWSRDALKAVCLDFRPAPKPDPTIIAAENAIALFADAVQRRDTRDQHDRERKAIAATAVRLASELRAAR